MTLAYPRRPEMDVLPRERIGVRRELVSVVREQGDSVVYRHVTPELHSKPGETPMVFPAHYGPERRAPRTVFAALIDMARG